ncbi:MAG: hypothetical protein EBW42_12770 [Rhodobacterales bacterium]|nr:hypothetical protein [Rhodobacterales bacterium]
MQTTIGLQLKLKPCHHHSHLALGNILTLNLPLLQKTKFQINFLMKKSSKPEKAQDDGERRRKLQFKRKKQRNQEPRVNLKNVKSMDDLDEYDDYQF